MNKANSGEIRKGSPLETVLSRLDDADSLSSGGYQALCPAHDDHDPSLSVSEGDDGRVLLNCHASCDTEDVVAALDLDIRDLFPDDADASWEPWDGSEVEAYTYLDGEGNPLFQVVRYEMRDEAHPAYGEKKFLQRAKRPEDADAGKKGCPDGFVWGRQGTPPVLYHLPRVRNATKRGEKIFFVEGEKDAETLANLGLTATCLPGGADASSGWTQEMSAALSGADVVCIPDNDEPGETFMEEVASQLDGTAAEVRIVHLPDLPAKGDVTDWLERGGSRQELLRLAEEADVYRPPPESAEEVAELCEREGGGQIAFEHADLLAQAPPAEYPPIKSRIKEATGINLNDLQSAVQAARNRLEEAREEERRKERKEKLRTKDASMVVVTGRPSFEVVDDLCDAVEEGNDPPRLFSREEKIVRVNTDEEGRVRLTPVSEALFDDQVSRATICTDKDYNPRDPSKRLIERVIERVDVPKIRGITRVPILRPDGSVMDSPGYDRKTRLLYRPPSGSHGLEVPEAPSMGDVEEALGWLEEAWTDHPFADEASWANTLALALSPVVRPLLGDANVPLCIIDATRAGSGKSLLAEIAGTIATGQTPATMSAPKRDEEWRKQITAQLKSGERFIVVDDVSGTLDSSSLRRVITSSAWSDRVLGASRQIRLPAEATWCATGNNLRPRGDMVRRCYLIRLDTEMVRPWERDEFKHSQPEWTRKNREELSASLLTLVKAWIEAGRPAPDAPSLGSFEEWCRIVGGILEHAGVEGFLQNLDELEETGPSEDDDWRVLLRAIYTWQKEILGQETFTAPELCAFVRANRSDSSGKKADVAERILQRLPDGVQDKILSQKAAAKSLGKTLSFKEGRRYPGGWHVVQRRRERGVSQWQVRKGDEGHRGNGSENLSDAPAPDTSAEKKVGGGGSLNGDETRPQSHKVEEETSSAEEAPF